MVSSPAEAAWQHLQLTKNWVAEARIISKMKMRNTGKHRLSVSYVKHTYICVDIFINVTTFKEPHLSQWLSEAVMIPTLQAVYLVSSALGALESYNIFFKPNFPTCMPGYSNLKLGKTPPKPTDLSMLLSYKLRNNSPVIPDKFTCTKFLFSSIIWITITNYYFTHLFLWTAYLKRRYVFVHHISSIWNSAYHTETTWDLL